MDRRDRHGRGMRGPLAHPPVPIALTRRQEFDDLVRAAVERVDAFLLVEHGVSLDGVEFAVEDLPRIDPGEEPDEVPFGRVDPGDGDPGRPGARALVVVYRRTVELRTDVGEERAELVHDVVVELVADLLGRDPDDIDPGYED